MNQREDDRLDGVLERLVNRANAAESKLRRIRTVIDMWEALPDGHPDNAIAPSMRKTHPDAHPDDVIDHIGSILDEHA